MAWHHQLLFNYVLHPFLKYAYSYFSTRIHTSGFGRVGLVVDERGLYFIKGKARG